MPGCRCTWAARSPATRAPSGRSSSAGWPRARPVRDCVLALVGLVLVAWNVPASQGAPLLLLTLGYLVTGLMELVHHAFRGAGRTDLESTISASQRLVTLGLGLAVLAWRPDVTLLSAALVIAPIGALIWSFVAARRLDSSRHRPIGAPERRLAVSRCGESSAAMSRQLGWASCSRPSTSGSTSSCSGSGRTRPSWGSTARCSASSTRCGCSRPRRSPLPYRRSAALRASGA